ncbi:MAG TPA: isoprenylcysteine carboxylmethyltransferase family protein, partial [Anaerolineales bacterium]
MDPTRISDSEQPKKTRYMPLWLTIPMALAVWEGIPWALSLLGPRYGWAGGRPGFWNWLGLVPVLLGSAGFLWGVIVHSAQSPKGMEWELDRSYMLSRGLYAFSRNPMYLAELVLILGWVVFYGSLAVLAGALAWWALFKFYQIPLEERILENTFGDSYR